jgi:tRNA-intron endonuclease
MENKEEFIAYLTGNVLSSNSKKAYTLLKAGSFGEMNGSKVIYSLYEGMFLLKNRGMIIHSGKRVLEEGEVNEKFSRIERKFPLKYKIYEDLRGKGFIVKSGIKYGSDFSIYDKGRKPGKDHSSWLLSAERWSEKIKMEELILKNRVANSTKKKTILAIESGEGGIVYYEMSWKKL